MPSILNVLALGGLPRYHWKHKVLTHACPPPPKQIPSISLQWELIFPSRAKPVTVEVYHPRRFEEVWLHVSCLGNTWQNHGFDLLKSTCINSPQNLQKSHSDKAQASSNHTLPALGVASGQWKEMSSGSSRTGSLWTAWTIEETKVLEERSLCAGPNYRILLLFPYSPIIWDFLTQFQGNSSTHNSEEEWSFWSTGAVEAKAAKQ